MSQPKSNHVLNEELFPRGGPLEPIFIDGFVYGLSNYPIQQGELMYACQVILNEYGEQERRYYYLGVCLDKLEGDTIIRFKTMSENGQPPQVCDVPAEVCARLINVIPLITITEDRPKDTLPTLEVMAFYN